MRIKEETRDKMVKVCENMRQFCLCDEEYTIDELRFLSLQIKDLMVDLHREWRFANRVDSSLPIK